MAVTYLLDEATLHRVFGSAGARAIREVARRTGVDAKSEISANITIDLGDALAMITSPNKADQEVERLRRQVSDLQRQVESSKGTSDKLRRDMADLSVKVADLGVRLSMTNAQKDKLRRRVDDIEKVAHGG